MSSNNLTQNQKLADIKGLNCSLCHSNLELKFIGSFNQVLVCSNSSVR